MFDELLRELKRLERGVSVPVTVTVDDDGHLDRRCPSPTCQAEFKVLLGDWKQKVRDDVVFCPICRHEAPSTEWSTQDQRAYLAKAGMAHVSKVIGSAIQRGAASFNARQPRGGFLSLSMSYRPSPDPILVPPEAAELFRQQFCCEACACRYSSLGAAFFCPACGHNSASTTFTAAVAAVRARVAHVPEIRKAIAAGAGPDAAADAARQLLEDGLVKIVASFQRYAEARFAALPNASSFKVRKNVFQNLGDSNELWRKATGKGYEDHLVPSDLAELVVFFQQRHLLSHKEGIVDQEYIDKSGEKSYVIGQKLVIRETAVLRLADLIERLGACLR